MRGNFDRDDKLVRDFEQLTDGPGLPRGLPNSCYTDPDWFRFERDEVIGRSWTAIAYGSELSDPGYAKPVDLMGIPLLIVRNKTGDLCVFHNVCSHRGMKLVATDTRLRTVIRCPYHSWSYDLDGRLLSTPLVGGIDKNDCEGLDKSEHGLKPVHFAVWMDIIFVSLSGNSESFQDFIAPLEARWANFLHDRNRSEIRPATTGSNLELNIASNWKLAVENYCEAYHLPWVHPALNDYSPLDQHFNITDGESMSGQGTHVYRLASIAGTRLPLIQGWPNDKLQYAEYISLYPNTLLGLQADHLFSVIVMPKKCDLTQEKLQISYVGDGSTHDKYGSCRTAVLNSWDTVFREDIFAVEGMQAGRHSPGFNGGVLTPVQDIPTRHFHTWVAGQYRRAMPQK
ncbi:MAG: aromatic ring-hydroxylating dioxygenase subunit alpha [Woeseiaceae bacterium]|nr:aromatic ring-hydroxylating dioxygenase subunit alpha [Woeseiaceae bacterium]